MIDCTRFKDLIQEYNFEDLDLLVVDTEGYDGVLVKNFIENLRIRPTIIFEWIHIEKDEIKSLIKLLKQNDYNVLKISKDVVCFQKNLNIL